MGSRFLYANPSFLEGAARLLDLGGTLTEFNESITPEQADYFAMRSDWYLVGHDLSKALREFHSEIARRK